MHNNFSSVSILGTGCGVHGSPAWILESIHEMGGFQHLVSVQQFNEKGNMRILPTILIAPSTENNQKCIHHGQVLELSVCEVCASIGLLSSDR